jgi:uncharacterized membrane protein YidH (DUF202 family)
MISDDDLEQKPIKHIINEMQLVLSEKRTALSLLRTGIAILVIPMSVLTVLLAASRYFDLTHQLKYAIPLTIMNIGLIVMGLYLIVKAIRQIKKCDLSASLLLKHSEYLRDLLDFRE